MKLMGKTTILDRVERFGDKIPHPFYMFIFLCLGVVCLSWWVSRVSSGVIHPGSGELIQVKNLLSAEGLVYILQSTVDNFIQFKPLGLVLCMMMAVGFLQEVGLADAAIKTLLLNAPRRLITASIFTVGILGNLASDAAFVLVPPLAGIVFAATNRHPIVGICAGFVAVAAGFTANFFIAGTDVLLSGITNAAAASVGDVALTPAANWYFMILSVPILVVLGTVMTDFYIEPRFMRRYGASAAQAQAHEDTAAFQVGPLEKRALQYTLVVALLYMGLILLLILPSGAILANADGGLVPSPFLNGIIPIIMGFFLLCSLTYALAVKVITRWDDVPALMGRAMSHIGGYVVLVFVIAQFIAWFNWSNLSVFFAVNGADWLSGMALPNVVMLGGLMVLAGLLNLIVFSGSAQWSIMAPVFVPLFMLLGMEPAVIQMAYRIGDSTTNIISPTNPYIPMVLALIAQHDARVKFGTFLSMMLPYAVLFLSIWGSIFLIYQALGLPVGPA
ncbi:MAG: AbgT family transporter [Neisseriaceae bacterium]|nr:AbgT family transporter [Neisseriaceae bacterium]